MTLKETLRVLRESEEQMKEINEVLKQPLVREQRTGSLIRMPRNATREAKTLRKFLKRHIKDLKNQVRDVL